MAKKSARVLSPTGREPKTPKPQDCVCTTYYCTNLPSLTQNTTVHSALCIP